MNLGLRAKLFIISLILIAGFGVAAIIVVESRLVVELNLAPTPAAVGDLRTLPVLLALVGLIIAVFMSGVAGELMVRTLRSMVDEALEQATGEAPRDADDEQHPAGGRSLGSIARDLRGAVGDLAEERDRLETILEQMHDAVLVLDAKGRVSLTNDAANHLLMMDDDDVGRPLMDAVRAPLLSELADRVARSGAGNKVTTEFEMNHATPRQVLAHAAAIRNDGGVVVVMHDVTEIRRLERVRRDFVANVSHELRTPVAVIRANAETLLDGALQDDDRGTGFVEGIHRSSERLSLLIGDLLDLSRIEAGHYATDIRSVVVRTAVDAVVDGLIFKAGRSVEIVNEVDVEVCVMADTTGLSQILQNLLDNAIKFAPDDGHVWVRARPGRNITRIEVEDDGPGIARRHRSRVFERFYRIDPGRSRQLGGTGLGLAIVKHLVERMGGSVGVDAAPESGSVFWVELPPAS